MSQCIIERRDIDGIKLSDDISCIDFSDEPQCDNCNRENIGSMDIVCTEESYDIHKRFHGQLVRINILKENKND